ncbi:hypothetical protein LSTR_LSTR007625 [Laodelphax striatellus]|uniref:FHA domain-containing protein n=1 Tax=Laodelphax striatellus TaxID=195883 RepID=A0A482WIW6_LAOST|nr:hypothetical protein LSTR_LSTR007625 [Laodelphax striatellus]
MSVQSSEESVPAEVMKNESNIEDDASKKTLFKVPVVLGLRKKPKTKSIENDGLSDHPRESNQIDQNQEADFEMEDYDEDEPQDYFGYKIPKWSRMPPSDRFAIEEVKGEACVFTKSVRKEFYLFGRKENCHGVSRHQSISRYHAFIQYGNPDGDERNPGFYLFDMDTTHGSFINNQRIEPSTFVKLNVDTDRFHFGFSTRRYAIRTAISRLMADRRKKIEEETESQVEDEKQPETWVDWGMGEDADEESDLSHNPYASELNEELYLDDPKKTLRGWFEREGQELNYDVEQKRPGEYCCRVAIPVDELGETLRAEATVKGKKKEAVVQAALEACRVLDKYGLLRQSFHSKKAKVKDWAENDFYDSDDDLFFDRTGDIEKKKMKRMRAHGKVETKVHTYESLLNDHKEILEKISESSKHIEKLKRKLNRLKTAVEDHLDDESFDSVAFQMDIAGYESDIKKATKDLEQTKDSEKKLVALINLARPPDQPILLPQSDVKQRVLDEKPHASSEEKLAKSATEQERKTNTAKTPASNHLDSEQKGHPEPPNKKSKLEMEANEQNASKKKVVSSNQPKIPKKTKKDEEKNSDSRRDRNEANQSKKEEDYSTTEWTPPVGQTGDGRTHLNDKFGY